MRRLSMGDTGAMVCVAVVCVKDSSMLKAYEVKL